MTTRLAAVVLAASVFAWACAPDEPTGPTLDSGTAVVDASANVVFYDLDASAQTATPEQGYHITFMDSETGDEPVVRLHTGFAAGIQAANLGDVAWDSATADADVEGQTYAYDNPDGSSYALAGWADAASLDDDRVESVGNLYIIRVSQSEGPGQQVSNSYLKFKINSVGRASGEVSFVVGALDSSIEPAATILTKAEGQDGVYVDLTNPTVAIPVNAAMETWDLMFTPYLVDIGIQYVVSGIYVNGLGRVEGYRLEQSFDTVTMADASLLTSARDVVGYDWKEFDNQSFSWSYQTDWTYVIRTTEGQWAKIAFVDYTNDIGESGYPTFRYTVSDTAEFETPVQDDSQ